MAHATSHAWSRQRLGGETMATLTETGIEVAELIGAARLIPYADITAVNLRVRPRRSAAAAFVCSVEARGVPPLEIRSVSWPNPLWPQSRADTYRPFVLTLHARLADRQPQPLFAAGDPPWYFALQVAVWIVPFPVIFLLLHDVPWEMRLTYTGMSVFPIGIMALIYWYRRLKPNLPRPYDPRALPGDLLPSIQGTAA
jgi:hypothetical protein